MSSGSSINRIVSPSILPPAGEAGNPGASQASRPRQSLAEQRHALLEGVHFIPTDSPLLDAYLSADELPPSLDPGEAQKAVDWCVTNARFRLLASLKRDCPQIPVVIAASTHAGALPKLDEQHIPYWILLDGNLPDVTGHLGQPECTATGVSWSLKRNGGNPADIPPLCAVLATCKSLVHLHLHFVDLEAKTRFGTIVVQAAAGNASIADVHLQFDRGTGMMPPIECFVQRGVPLRRLHVDFSLADIGHPASLGAFVKICERIGFPSEIVLRDPGWSLSKTLERGSEANAAHLVSQACTAIMKTKKPLPGKVDFLVPGGERVAATLEFVKFKESAYPGIVLDGLGTNFHEPLVTPGLPTRPGLPAEVADRIMTFAKADPQIVEGSGKLAGTNWIVANAAAAERTGHACRQIANVLKGDMARAIDPTVRDLVAAMLADAGVRFNSIEFCHALASFTPGEQECLLVAGDSGFQKGWLTHASGEEAARWISNNLGRLRPDEILRVIHAARNLGRFEIPEALFRERIGANVPAAAQLLATGLGEGWIVPAGSPG